MSIGDYYKSIAKELKRKSDDIRIGFSTHALSAGENREDIVGDFLRENLSQSFGVDSGLILSRDGEFSNQADLVIVDRMNNAPLYPNVRNKLWLVEAVYAMVEVKTNLSPHEIKNSIDKCIRFKRLTREYQSVPSMPKIKESLFIIWGFSSSSPKTLKENIITALDGIPVDEQPDFIIIPDSMIVTAGSYRKLSQFGQTDSKYQEKIIKENQGKKYEDIFETIEFIQSNENSILIFLTWLTSWLKGAGVRSAPFEVYLDKAEVFGIKI